MKIYENKPIGYCPGVSLAIADTIKIQQDKKREIYTFGNVVHNEVVTQDFINQKIIPLKDTNNLKNGDTLVFPAHGLIYPLKEELSKKGVEIFETTCPIVQNIHDRVKNSLEQRKQIIFIGKENHSETNSLISLNKNIFLFDVNTEKLISEPSNQNEIDVYCQTTISELAFNKAKEILQTKFSKINFFDTRCEEVKKRQLGILDLPKDVKAVFVIGGSESSNTRELFEIAKKYFYTTQIYCFTVLEEIQKYKKEIKGIKDCAIITGSSTPAQTIESLKRFLCELW